MKTLTTGYVVVSNDDNRVLDYSFAHFHRDAKQEVRQIFSHLTDKQFIERFRVERAVQTVEVINWF